MIKLRDIRHQLAKTFLRIPLQWYRHRQLHHTDIMIASYPRSGSTWLRFLFFELLLGYPATFETINKPGTAVPEMAYCRDAPTHFHGEGRLIKTHEQYRKNYTKAIYLVRDVRDVVISEYNYALWLNIYNGTLDNYIDQFLEGKTNGFGSWTHHVLSWYRSPLRQSGSLHFIRYEDLLESGLETMQSSLEFLGIACTDKEINDALAHNSFVMMQKKETIARQTVLKEFRKDVSFVRRGLAGQWQEVLSPNQILKIEQQSAEAMELLGYDRSTVNF